MAEDGTSHSYSISITRTNAELTLSDPFTEKADADSDDSTFTEGETITLTLSRAEASSEELSVTYTLTEDASGGDMVPAANQGQKTATIPANGTEVKIDIPTIDDQIWEKHASDHCIDYRSGPQLSKTFQDARQRYASNTGYNH